MIMEVGKTYSSVTEFNAEYKCVFADNTNTYFVLQNTITNFCFIVHKNEANRYRELIPKTVRYALMYKYKGKMLCSVFIDIDQMNTFISNDITILGKWTLTEGEGI